MQELPRDCVFFSSGLLPKNADFDRAHIDYRTGLSLEDTVESVDADPVPDPDGGRNRDQHAALRDD